MQAPAHWEWESQIVLSGCVEVEHWPEVGLHVPFAWQSSAAAQVTGFEPWHTPDWQASVWVQAFPSLHAAPSGLAANEQVPVLG